MKTKWVIPVIAGVSLVAGATVVVYNEICRLHQLLSIKDKMIENLRQINSELGKANAELQEQAREDEAHLEYLEDAYESSLNVIEQQMAQIEILEERVNHFESSIWGRIFIRD